METVGESLMLEGNFQEKLCSRVKVQETPVPGDGLKLQGELAPKRRVGVRRLGVRGEERNLEGLESPHLGESYDAPPSPPPNKG